MKNLTRSKDEKWLGGVCGGISFYTGIDVNLIRLLLAIGTILGAGSLLVAYMVAWVIMPAQTEPVTVWAEASDAPTTAHEPEQPSA